jgi:uncharacterized protein (TIGR02453 family)
VTFSGIPDDAFAFYEGLRADNSKTYWTAHRPVYEESVKAPLVELLGELEDDFGAGSVFRPYRDVRFAKDKTPYKDHQGAFVEVADAVGYYVQVNADGLMVAGGWYDPQGPQVARYREVVDGPAGAELARIVDEARSQGFEVGGDRLKTRPRGVDPDHPRIELLRHRSVVATQRWEPEPWVHTRKAFDAVCDSWHELEPLVGWPAASVGPGDPDRHRR